ncbi:peptide/nickel transport system substrate-binding protein [Haloactinospora alba]|uniref:Peptide/nickel transport system substrate-binding protein n=1 Tax=Haloactinospora alba TaxID=405555 RepID=A0A543NJ01_9ACTN|nr:ABC transporter substrate-binding protein [Haloactinospora alba]TQN31825.1 peptide/nickel transport system substrate-binding protein [Haloactinospora alba]
MRKRVLGWIALGASASLVLSACGTDGASESSAEFDQGNSEVVNASDERGGTLRYAISGNIESTDPGNTYYGYIWNFSRYYARTLYTYAKEPGEAGREVVPDLAKDMPKVSDDGTTYTVELKEGLKYEDGSEIVAEDIKYAIARSNFGDDALPNGPKYYKEHLAESGDYEGPYADTDDPLEGFDGIETPDDHTLVFHLKERFVDFKYVLVQPQTSPIPAEEDTGERYQSNVMSSGPYKFDGDWSPGDGLTLVRNGEWDAESDPIRDALPDKVTVKEGMDQDEIDQRLENGDLDVDLSGTGLGPAKKGELLQNDDTKARLDNPENSAHYYTAVNTQVEPLDDRACRQAVQYALNRDQVQRAWGGESGGSKATQILPPVIPGADPDMNLYPSEEGKGDIDKAEEKLAECGEEDGFSTNIGVRSDRPAEVEAAQAVETSLDRAGIDVSIKQYPSDSFTNSQAGSPDFVHENELGLNIYGWMPDWPTGYGYFGQIIHGDAIKQAGNTNISELDNAEINEKLNEAIRTEDEQERAELYSEIDEMAMEEAVIVPMVFHKAVLYRPDNLTNVFFNPSWKMYDYMALGTTRGSE